MKTFANEGMTNEVALRVVVTFLNVFWTNEFSSLYEKIGVLKGRSICFFEGV